MNNARFNIGEVEVSLDSPLFVMAGPCVIESKDHCLDIASRLVDVGQRTGIGMIFKASFDKANRSSLQSFRGPGLDKGLDILAAVRRQTNMAVVTDPTGRAIRPRSLSEKKNGQRSSNTCSYPFCASTHS